jgi:glycosyltransferase involved in cell wall biosynthesis
VDAFNFRPILTPGKRFSTGAAALALQPDIMRHLIICREYPPVPNPPGGIGTYVTNIARLLAEAGEEVHVIGPRWAGAPAAVERSVDGRLTVHRVYGEHAANDDGAADMDPGTRALAGSTAWQQAFAWSAMLLAESLVEREEIDVIEGEEWEGALYFLQLRRALGLGPRRQPPCLIHFHSPTELIYQANEQPTGAPTYRLIVPMEQYCIGTADAWVCPSRFLARQAEAHYALPAGAVATIPLPMGSTPRVARDADVWARGPICFVGRLEPRKGVIEWVEAAIGAAQRDPTLAFDFVGADMAFAGGSSMRAYLESRIPAALRPAFRFHGSQPREAVLQFLARARAAVVPSRWENFPNTCVEAMASGLPVIVSPNGGMRELVDDGRTGWVADSASPAALAVALDRMLRLAPEELAAAGRAAADAVRTTCDNTRIVEQHLALRRAVGERGASRSRRLPPSYPWARGAPSRRPPAAPTAPERAGTVVVLALGDGLNFPARPDAGAVLAATTESIDAQDRPPAARVLVVDAPGMAYAGTAEAVDAARARGWRVVQTAAGEAGPAAAQAALGGAAPLGVLLVAPGPGSPPTSSRAASRCWRRTPRWGS